MTQVELDDLMSQEAFLLGHLEEFPEMNVINRGSIESRIEELRERIQEGLEEGILNPIQTVLTFQGTPVCGSHGVLTRFGAKATNLFQELLHSTGEAVAQGKLNPAGLLANQEKYDMMITGTAVGSFGFQLEEVVKSENSPLEENRLKTALETTWKILKASVDSDEALSDCLADIDKRAINDFFEFVSFLVKSDALCSFRFGDKAFAFRSREELRVSVDRLNTENFQEGEEVFDGYFLYVLPSQRMFEASQEGVTGSTLLRGKIAREMGKDVVKSIIANHDKPARLVCEWKSLKNGKRSYVLKSFTIKEDVGESS